MAGETILVIDADESIEQRITIPLEAAGYMVFTALSQVLNTDALEKLSPAAIYIKPLSPTAAGFKPCKTIHELPSLKNVPIVLLGSLKESSDPRFSTVYGITDSLQLTFRSDELIEKTEKILGKTPSLQPPKIDERFEIEAMKEFQLTPPVTELKEDGPRLAEEEFTLPTSPPKRMRPFIEESLDKKEERMPRKQPNKSHWLDTLKALREKHSSLFWPAVGAVILLVLIGVGFLVYDQLMPGAKVVPIRSAKAPSKVPGTSPVAQVPPGKKVADAAPPASPSPTSPEPSASPPLPKTPSAAAPSSPTPASAVPSAAGPSSSASAKPAPPSASPSATPPSSPVPQKPSLSPEPAPQLPHKVSYSVQLGAFKNEVYAQALVKELREKGYEAIAKSGVTKDNSPVYRVFVGRFEGKKTAENLAREIQSKEGVKTTLYSE